MKKKKSEVLDIDGKVWIDFKTKEVELKVPPLEAYMLIKEHRETYDVSGLWGEYIGDNFTYTSKLSNGWKIKQIKKGHK